RRAPEAGSRLAAAASLGRGADGLGPERLGLGQDLVPEAIAGPRERERGMRVQALELLGARGARDAEPERVAAVRPGQARREPDSERALFLGRLPETLGQLRIGAGPGAETLDASGSLEARDCSDQVPARQVVGRRERLA